MLRTYKIPAEAVQKQKKVIGAAFVTLLLGVPIFTIAFGLMLHLDRTTLATRDMISLIATLGIPCAMLWLGANMMTSFQIELEDDRITRVQGVPLGRAPQKICLARPDVTHIREVAKRGLYVYGRITTGKYIDLHIPRSLENYDDLRSRLAAWHPIRESRW